MVRYSEAAGKPDMNEMTEMLGIRHPVIQGAMNPISNPEMVAAVSEAGGFGLLATGLKQPEFVLEEIEAVRRITDKPFGINITLDVRPEFSLYLVTYQ
jgi:enoyl-[acyl-carrier protein] reductase II